MSYIYVYIIFIIFFLVLIERKIILYKYFKCTFILLINMILLKSFLKLNLFFYLNYWYIYNNNFIYVWLLNININNLFILFIIIVCLYIFSKNYLIFKNIFIIYIFYYFLFSFLKNFEDYNFILKEKFFLFHKNIPKLNLLLLNNIIIIHPSVINLVYGFILVQCLQNFVVFLWNKKKFFFLFHKNTTKFCKHCTKMFFNLITVIYKIIIMLLFTLLLGSLWANQELIWANWWSWDIIEIIALNFSILYIYFIHFIKKINFYYLKKSIIIKINFFFSLFYIFIRLDATLSLHSFNLFALIEIYFYYIFLLC